MQISILGSLWSIEERSEKDDKRLDGCDGYTDWTTRQIVIEREITGNLGDMEAYIRKVKRHEIAHAYAFESGLAECSSSPGAWAENEEMIDWVARIGPKIYNTWVEAGAIIPEDYSSELPKKQPPAWFAKAYQENADKAINLLLHEIRRREEKQCCPLCGEVKGKTVTWKGYTVELREMHPLPAISLSSGKTETEPDDPFMALAVEAEDEEDYYAIKYCPVCGKYLDVKKG